MGNRQYPDFNFVPRTSLRQRIIRYAGMSLSLALMYLVVAIFIGWVVGADVPGTPALQSYGMAISAITSLLVGPLSFAIGRLTAGVK